MRKIIATTMKEYLNENIGDDIKYTVFHSSNEKFNYFDLSKITNLGGDLYGKGFYFTDNINYSKKFGKYTYKCSIILNNPINLTGKSARIQLTNILKNSNISDADSIIILDLINGGNYTTAFRYIRKYIPFSELKNMFDGIIGYADDESGGKEYVVYDPKNINIIEILDK